MTVALSGKEIASQLAEKFPESIIESGRDYLVVTNEALPAVAAFLKDVTQLVNAFFWCHGPSLNVPGSDED